MDKIDLDGKTPAELLASVRAAMDKGFKSLQRRGMLSEDTMNGLVTPILNFIQNKVEGHDCPAGAALMLGMGKQIGDMIQGIAMFEDHIADDHPKSEAEQKHDAVVDAVTEVKDNVIHVDLSKGTRKN